MQNVQLSSARPGLSQEVTKTLTNTFMTVGAMLMLTALASYFSLELKLGLGVTLALFAGSIGLIFAANALRNSGYGLAILALFAVIQGIVLGPVMGHYISLKNGTSILLMTTALTALATFSVAGYAIISRKDFSQMRGFLMGGLIVLIVASLIGMFFTVPGLSLTLAALGSVLFMGWLLYDVGSIVTGQETNYISASLSIFLDILNLFTSLLRLVGGGSRD